MFHAQHILVLAPHTDDGELGCGASLYKYTRAGVKVTYIAFSTCNRSLPTGVPFGTLVKECTASNQILGIGSTRYFDFDVRSFPHHRQEILEHLIQLGRELSPDTVLLPARHDIHQDHETIFHEGLRAFKHCNLLGYELPWNNTRFAPVYFEPIDEEHLQAKQRALSAYASQQHRSYMNADFIRSLAVVRGIQSGCPYAEAFEVYHMKGALI